MNKTKSFLIIILALVVMLMSSCKPTPENLVVQQKDQDISQSIKTTAVPQKATPEPEPKVEETPKPCTKVLEHWTHEAVSDNTKVTINIDTDVVVPNEEKFPVIGLIPRRFGQKDVDSIVDTFIGDKRLFRIKYEMTREDIEEATVLTKLEMKDLDSDMASSNEITSLKELEKHGKKELKRLEEMLEDAPETDTILEEDTDISTPIDDEYGEHLRCLVLAEVDMGKKNNATIMINNREHRGSQVVFKNTGLKDDPFSPISFASTNSVDDDQLHKTAYELLDKLHIKNMMINACENGYITNYENKTRECYKVSFLRAVHDMPLLNIRSVGTSMESEYSAPPLKPEYVNVYIDESGVIAFEWNSPMQIVEEINSDVALKDISELKEIFDQQFFNKYTFDSESIVYKRYNINSISMAYARIVVPDKKDSYMIVPVWDFFGTNITKYTDKITEKRKKFYESLKNDGVITESSMNDEDEVVRIEADSLLTINGVTGTSLNRNLGY